MNDILEFKNDFDFLSNMYPCTVTYKGITYKCSEAAFQAQKYSDINIQKEFAEYDGKQAKYHGGPRGDHKLSAAQKEEWNAKRVSVMEEVVRAKFEQNDDLKQKLIETGGVMIYEGRSFRPDKFWGISLKTMEGQNHLGVILMKVRDSIK